MLESAHAGVQTLMDDSKVMLGSSRSTAALVAASISAPLILPSSNSSSILPVVRCAVSFNSRAQPLVQLQSRSRSGGAFGTNLQAAICCHVELVSHTPAASSGPDDASSDAAKQLLGTSGRMAVGPAMVAAGGMMLQPEHAAPGYQCHPAVLDATLHLGVFAAPDQRDGGNAATPRVPVAAAYFHASARGCTIGSTSWPLMRCDEVTASATTASYALLSDGRAPTAFQLQHLQSKAVGRTNSAAAKLATVAAASLFSYSAQYAADSAAAGPGSSPSGLPITLTGSRGRLTLPGNGSAAAGPAVFAAAQQALRMLQLERQVGSLNLQSATAAQADVPAGAPVEQLTAALAAAAVHGMLKSAAAEAPAAPARLPAYNSRSYLQAAGPAAPAPAGDVFAASHLHQGAWLLPQLLQESQAADAMLQVQLGMGKMTISGGMGSLGQLVAGWMAAMPGSSRGLVLWGRSAAARLPAPMIDSDCLVTALQCDAAAAADVVATMDDDRCTAAYVHAGGRGVPVEEPAQLAVLVGQV